MVWVDEIRGRVLSRKCFRGEPRLGPMDATPSCGPFYCLSFVVVNRSPLHAGKERNEAASRRILRHLERVQELSAPDVVMTVGFSPPRPTLRARPPHSIRVPLRGQRGKKKVRGVPTFLSAWRAYERCDY
jgi:hypothetical protein